MHTQLRRRFATTALVFALTGSAFFAAQPAGAIYDRDCSDFASQRQAQRFFKNHNPRRDPHRLDGDNDGIACEALA
ncbi:MAG: excalibur calcium-binding domain-containing protein [Solirubrobacterales bacterium]